MRQGTASLRHTGPHEVLTMWQAILGAATQIGGELLGAHSAHKANRTNIRLQREQQAWEERMSNTAVSRHADDIEAAGGNRALAFVNGQQASTPSVSPAQVQPEWDRGAGARTVQAIQTAAAIDNVKANTAKQLAEARSLKVEADIREKLEPQETTARHNDFVERVDQADLKTKILRSQDVQSAAEAERLRKTVDSMVEMAKQQARAGKLDLDALENVAKVGGLEASRATGIVKLIVDMWRTSQNKRY